MIKAVFFDAIKTLFSPYPSEAGLYQAVIKNVTGKELSIEELKDILKFAMDETEKLDAVKGNSIQQWEHYPTKIAELIGCEASECKNVGDKLRYETWGNPNNYRLYDDILGTLELLKKKNIYIACVSNEDGWLSNFFDHFGIKNYFEFILTSAEVGVEKPNPAIFKEAINKTAFMPEEILFVGDSLISDYYGAGPVGMKPVLIDREFLCEDVNITKINDMIDIKEFL